MMVDIAVASTTSVASAVAAVRAVAPRAFFLAGCLVPRGVLFAPVSNAVGGSSSSVRFGAGAALVVVLVSCLLHNV